MPKNLEKKVNSGYIGKNKDGSFEVKYFETLKQRQEYLLENDDLTRGYSNKLYPSRYVSDKIIVGPYCSDWVKDIIRE